MAFYDNWSWDNATDSLENWITNDQNMVTDEHSQWVTNQMQNLMSQLQDSNGNFTQENYDSGSPFDNAMLQALSGHAFNKPKDVQGMNDQQVLDYYQSTMYDPAVRQYENVTRPAWLEKVSNLHSSFRDTQEQRGYEDLYGGLSQQRGNLLYNNLLNNQGLQKFNNQTQLQTNQLNSNQLMNAINQNANYDPMQIALNLLSNQQSTSQIVEDPSGLGTLDQYMGLLGNLMNMGGV